MNQQSLRHHLKIDSVLLASESKIFRTNEVRLLRRIRQASERQKTKAAAGMHNDFSSMSYHRRHVLRTGARAVYLARAFVAGKDYSTLEHKLKDPALLNKVVLPKMMSVLENYNYQFSIVKLHEWFMS